jgi:hypothetical protein
VVAVVAQDDYLAVPVPGDPVFHIDVRLEDFRVLGPVHMVRLKAGMAGVFAKAMNRLKDGTTQLSGLLVQVSLEPFLGSEWRHLVV